MTKYIYIGVGSVLASTLACNAIVVPKVEHCYREYYPVYAEWYKVTLVRTYGFEATNGDGKRVWVPMTSYERLREVSCNHN